MNCLFGSFWRVGFPHCEAFLCLVVCSVAYGPLAGLLDLMEIVRIFFELGHDFQSIGLYHYLEKIEAVLLPDKARKLTADESSWTEEILVVH